MGENSEGLAVLSIDGASMHQSGVVPPLLILQEIASRYENDRELPPGSFCASEAFRMIGGVGDGGLLAFMLGHFGMSINDTIHEYSHILEAVHQHPHSTTWTKDERTQRLEAALKTLVASKTGDENHPLNKQAEKTPECKVFVTTMHSLNLQHPILFRTYHSRTVSESLECTLVEAIRATTAMPDLFTHVTLGPTHRQINYVSPACHGFNNPIDQVRQEAKAAFPGHSISCIISLGCGHPGPVQIGEFQEGSARAVVQLAMDSLRAAEQTHRRLAGIPNLYFRFDVPYGLERPVLKLNPMFSEIQAHVTTYVRQQQTSDTIDSAVRQLIDRPPSVKALELDGLLPIEVTATVWVKKCPLPTPNFTGRRVELDHMHTYFSCAVGSSSHIYVIHGLGGSGKTQLLLQFVLECQNESPSMFDVIFFADASREYTLETDLMAIAVDQKIGETAADAIQWLSRQTDRWLLVLDNAGDKSFSIQKYIPNSIHGNVIITTRNPELTGLTSKDSGTVQIGDLEEWAAELLLRHLVGQRGRLLDDEDLLVAQVAKMLHCFPLAVTQAGSYIAATKCSYQEYIDLFHAERPRLLRERKGHVPDDYPWTVYTTWAMSFNQLKSSSRHFMQICSYLHYTAIPRDLFQGAVEAEPLVDADEAAQTWLSDFLRHSQNQEKKWDQVAFDDLVQNVMSFSLVDCDPGTRLFSFHPLVHEWTREEIQLTHGQDFPDLQCALQLVALSTPNTNDRSSESILLKRRLLPHLDTLIPSAANIASVPMAARLSAIYEQTARWNDVANVWERAIELDQYGGQSVLTAMQNLAMTYGKLGRHSEACGLQLSLLATRKEYLGEDHPYVLEDMNNLVATYQELGDYHEALALQRSVVSTSKRIMGDEDPSTLTTLNNLAVMSNELGNHVEALELHSSVLASRKRILHDDHPDVLTSMNGLGLVYHNIGKHSEALNLQLSVVTSRNRVLGDEHPDTLTATSNLAMTYQELGQNAKALELLLSVYECRKRIQGDRHPNTLVAVYNLALVYTGLERNTDATELLIPAISIAVSDLGAEHPITISLQQTLEGNLSKVDSRAMADSVAEQLMSIAANIKKCEQEGRWEDAIEQEEIAVEAFSGILGECHPTTVRHLLNLATNCLKLGRQDDGRRHIEKGYQLIKDDSFPSDGHLHEALIFEELYAQYCQGTPPEDQVRPRASFMRDEAESGIDENSQPSDNKDERSRQEKAADAAEARRKALDDQSKKMRATELIDNTAVRNSPLGSSGNSRNVSVTTLVTANQTTTEAEKAGKDVIGKGKANDLSSTPHARNELAELAEGPSTRSDNGQVVSNSKTRVDIGARKVHSGADNQEPEVLLPTSSTSLPPETRLERGADRGYNIARDPNPHHIYLENEAHQRFIANIELKKLKIEAKSKKQQGQYHLEITRLIVLALVILGVQWRG